MWDSEKLYKWAGDSSVLWIDRKSKAFAFLIVFCISTFGLVFLEYSKPWRLLKIYYASQENSTSFQLASWKVANDVSIPGDKVVFIGGSASRELTATDSFVTQSLRKLCGDDVTFVNSATPGQTLPETWATINALKSSSLKTLVYGFNDWKLSEGVRDTIRQASAMRLPFAAPPEMMSYLSSVSDRAAIAFPVPNASGWLYANRKGFKSTGGPSAEISDPFQSAHHRYTAPSKSLEEKHAIAARFLAESSYPMELKYLEAAEIFAALVRDLKQNGTEVVFLVLPQSSVLKRHSLYTKEMADEGLAVIRASGAKIYDWRILPELVENDFYDQTHILSSGRKKIHDKLVSMMAENFQPCNQQQDNQ